MIYPTGGDTAVLLDLMGPLRRNRFLHLRWKKGTVHQKMVPPKTDMATTVPRQYSRRLVTLDGGGYAGPST